MRKRMAGTISIALLALAGCGASEEYANNPRPPAPIDVGIVVSDKRIAVSPSTVGAGPAVLIISNQSSRSHEITLRPPEGSGRGCLTASAASGPINPMGTAHMTLQLVEGDCLVGVAGRGPGPARLEVGRKRPSAQQDLLQP